jgi:hypothetical protein
VATRYHKIANDHRAIEGLFVRLLLEAQATPPSEIVLDLDACLDSERIPVNRSESPVMRLRLPESLTDAIETQVRQ